MAMKENTIIFLPTGCGKTFISVLAMKRFLSQETRSFKEGGKVCIFVVIAVVLVDQQARVLERHLPISKAGRYSGQLNIDSWSREKWQEEFKKHEVLVMTAEILHIILIHSFIASSSLSVIVFDECHAAVGKNPISLTMDLLRLRSEVPRIIGMTATLLNGNAESKTKARQNVETLLQTFEASISYVGNEDVKCFSTKPREKIIGYEESCEPSDELNAAIEMLKRGERMSSSVFVIEKVNESPAKDIKKLNSHIVKYIADATFQLGNLGMYGGSKAALYGIQLLEFRKICEKQFSFNVQITNAINTLTYVQGSLEQRMSMSSLSADRVPYLCSNIKVQTLINLIREQKDEKGLDNFHCLVLVQRKTTAKILCTILKHVANIPEFSFIKPVFIVGGSGSSDPFPYNNDEIAKMSKTAIASFRNCDSNVLISTDVMEEGIDIPFCNCVIKFDRVGSYKSYVQSKGRARSQDSNYFVLVKNSEMQETRTSLEDYNEVQDYLWSVVRDPTINDEYQLDFESSTSETKEFRFETKTGAILLGTNAISILNKYCSLLRYDQYTDFSLTWEENRSGKEKYQACVAKLSLPEVAPVQLTVESDTMTNMKLAKQNVAFKMCVELHKKRELDDDLVPVAPNRKFKADPRWWPHWNIAEDIVADTEKKIGTSKRQSLYLHRIANCVQDCRPTSDKPSYLHAMLIKPKHSDPPTDRKYAVIYEELKKNPSFAIVSSKKMPKVCAFPAFLSVADLSVEIAPNYKEITLTKDEISKLYNFNELFFTEMTKCSTATADSDVGGKDYFVAPTKTNESVVSIDWDFVNRIEALDEDKPPKSKCRKLDVSTETYHGTVVKPWYRECGNQALIAPSANELVNYERLETLGDSFLKVAVSLFVYETCPLKNEGLLSDLKSRFLGNRNLFCCALNKRLPELMCVSHSAQGTWWKPPCFTSPLSKNLTCTELEYGKEEEVVTFSGSSKPKLVPFDDIVKTDRKHFFGAQSIKDKTIADCVEALIGVSLLDCGWNGAFDFLVWLEVLPVTVQRPNKTSMPLKQLLENGFKDPDSASSKSKMLPVEVRNVQELIGYNFRDPELLKRALTHPSYDPKNSYERLEFIGDSVLDFLITTYIYENCGLLTPGQLTDLRSALVNNITFAALTVKYGLNRFMLANSPKLLQVVDFFIKGRKASNHTIDEDVLVLCEEGEISLSEAITVPKALADVFEALAGAIFFDSGRDLNAVWNVFYPLMHDVIQSFCYKVPIEPVRELHKTFPEVKFEYNHDNKHGKMIATCRVQLGGKVRKFHGYGENKKMAKRAVAKFALYTFKKGLNTQ